jgi:hypothetical protein
MAPFVPKWDDGTVWDQPGAVWGPLPEENPTMANRLNIALAQQTITDITTHITGIRTLLAPYLGQITPAERAKLNALGDKRLAFAESGVTYIKDSPQFLPAHITVTMVDNDKSSYDGLKQIEQQMDSAKADIRTARMLAGSELLTDVEAYRDTSAIAAKAGVPGAETIAKSLKDAYPSAKGPHKDKTS